MGPLLVFPEYTNMRHVVCDSVQMLVHTTVANVAYENRTSRYSIAKGPGQRLVQGIEFGSACFVEAKISMRNVITVGRQNLYGYHCYLLSRRRIRGGCGVEDVEIWFEAFEGLSQLERFERWGPTIAGQVPCVDIGHLVAHTLTTLHTRGFGGRR